MDAIVGVSLKRVWFLRVRLEHLQRSHRRWRSCPLVDDRDVAPVGAVAADRDVAPVGALAADGGVGADAQVGGCR